MHRREGYRSPLQQIGAWGRRKRPPNGFGVESQPKTVLVHIKRRRTLVVEGNLFKIIQKSRKKNSRIFLIRVRIRTLRTSFG